LAKELVPTLIQKLTNNKENKNDADFVVNIPNLQIDVLTPTSTMPLGGNNAACVIAFCSSISQASSFKSMLDRLLRRTYQSSSSSSSNSGSDIGTPPTQFIGISTVGTERTNQFPYSMQNMMGGKLDQRRQVEEVLLSTVQQRVLDPPLDYTLIKMGEIIKKSSSTTTATAKSSFRLASGDVLDDPITIDTATDVLVQAIALQPFARNATLCVAGDVSSLLLSSSSTKKSSSSSSQSFWNEVFLCLDGPELFRMEENLGPVDKYTELVEYVQGWGNLLAQNAKGVLTTPIRAQPGLINLQSRGMVQQQDGVSLLFLPTATGKNYLSKSEERDRETSTSFTNKGSGGGSGAAAAAAAAAPSSSDGTTTTTGVQQLRLRGGRRDGGMDVVVEITMENQLRVRVRRCNYADDAIIKELSEKTMVKQFQDAMELWKKKF
jgi:hypothetical protein